MTEDKLTKQDVVKIITAIKVNYSEAYSGYGEEEMLSLVGCWLESLREYPRSLVNRAVKNAIETSEYAPKLSTIIREIQTILQANEPTDEELWAELTSVLGYTYQVSRYLSYPQHYEWANAKLDEIYSKLNKNLKLFVVTPSALVELAEMPEDSLRFERARFFKQMPILRKHAESKTSAQKFLLRAGSSVQALSDGEKAKHK